MVEINTDHLDTLPIAEWRKTVREALIKNEADRRELVEYLESLNEERERLVAEEQLIAQAVRAYSARLQTPSSRSPIAGDTLREVLIINFADPEGVIVGNEAIATLLDIGYFSNRRTADGATYTVLNKPPFEKIERGIYKIPTDSPEWVRLRTANGHVSPPSSPKEAQHDKQAITQSRYGEPSKPLIRARVDAIVSEALKLGGCIHTKQAIDALRQAGLSTKPSADRLNTQNVLSKSGKFEKAGDGFYLLRQNDELDPTPEHIQDPLQHPLVLANVQNPVEAR